METGSIFDWVTDLAVTVTESFMRKGPITTCMSNFGGKADIAIRRRRAAFDPKRTLRQGNLAGTENGLVASTTNMISADRSVVPLLKTCIGIPAGCPSIVLPASTWATPCGVF